MAIKTALRSYQAVRVLITPELEPLVMPQLLEIRELISEAFDVKLSTSTAVSKKQRIRWEQKEMTEWVTKLAEAVSKFEDRVEQLLRAIDKVEIALAMLQSVDYEQAKFQNVLATIQKTIDEMSLSGYSDLDSWVRVVGNKMANVLAYRLELALKGWNKTFKKTMEQEMGDDDAEQKEQEEDAEAAEGDLPTAALAVKVELEIVLRNQEISAIPAVPTVRSIFLNKLHEYFGVVCSLPRPKSGRYEVFDNVATKSSQGMGGGDDVSDTFDNLVQLVSPQVVADAYAIIEVHIQESSVFVDQWLAYQTLWDTQVADVAAEVGSDVEKWQALLLEAAEARSTLDSSATVAEFGPVIVKYGKVQSQINLKYDSWQKELQSSFAAILGTCVHETHQTIMGAKTKLEETTLDSTSTENIVFGVTFIQEVKQKVSIWAKEIESLRIAEKLLRKQRYAFGSDWMESSIVKGIYDSLLQILERRTRTMEQQIPLLQARVTAEDKTAGKQLISLLEGWEKDKPLRGNTAPPQALETLTKYEFSMKKAQ